MNCLAIWYKPKPLKPKEELGIELHLNLWKLNKKNGRKIVGIKNFLDIGIMIEKPDNVANIYIFLPFRITKSKIEDLGRYFKNNDLLDAIFNQRLNAIPSDQPKTLSINDHDKNKFFIYMIDIKNDVRMPAKNYGGSIINIKVSIGEDIKPIYYRIRINSDKLEGLYTRYKPESQWLESHYTNNELIDFRVNEKRNLDNSLLEEMHNSGEVFFNNVEYFVMREFKYDYVSSHQEMIRSRKLEADLWKPYVGNDCECGNIIAYHWKWDRVPGFNAFVKYKFVASDIKTKILFCLFLFLIALTGAILGTLFIKLFNI
jgi:hypothetical protein